MLCYERADALHKKEAEVRAIEVTDGNSLCEYLKGFWELIWNHKMFGYVYDIYSDDIKVIRENGIVIEGIQAYEKIRVLREKFTAEGNAAKLAELDELVKPFDLESQHSKDFSTLIEKACTVLNKF